MIAITGTPGTGKTGVRKALGFDCLDLNGIIVEQGFYNGVDTERGCLVADLEKLKEYIRKKEQKSLVIEGHLAHFLDPDVAIVLRANPIVLTERLRRKCFPPRKIKENVEAEAMDIILAETVECCEAVYEVDTSEKSVEEVASLVRTIIDAEIGGGEDEQRSLRERYKPGSVDWTGYLMVDNEFVWD